jgi:hypothetical protein
MTFNFQLMSRITNFKKILAALILAVLIITSVGCEEKGGKQLDKSMEDAAKQVNDLLGK